MNSSLVVTHLLEATVTTAVLGVALSRVWWHMRIQEQVIRAQSKSAAIMLTAEMGQAITFSPHTCMYTYAHEFHVSGLMKHWEYPRFEHHLTVYTKCVFMQA